MSAKVEDFPNPADTVVDVQEAATMAHQQLEETVRQRPYLAIAAGLGVGVVLGGGIPNWALRLGATSISRIAVGYAVSQLATEVAE